MIHLLSCDAVVNHRMRHLPHLHRRPQIMRKWTKELGGTYREGPLKTADRILAKAQIDYNNDLTKVLDVIRASAVFHSFEDLSNACVELAKAECEIIVVRFKDRMTNGPVLAHWRFILKNYLHLCPIIRAGILSTRHIYHLIGFNPAGSRID